MRTAIIILLSLVALLGLLLGVAALIGSRLPIAAPRFSLIRTQLSSAAHAMAHVGGTSEDASESPPFW